MDLCWICSTTTHKISPVDSVRNSVLVVLARKSASTADAFDLLHAKPRSTRDDLGGNSTSHLRAESRQSSVPCDHMLLVAWKSVDCRIQEAAVPRSQELKMRPRPDSHSVNGADGILRAPKRPATL